MFLICLTSDETWNGKVWMVKWWSNVDKIGKYCGWWKAWRTNFQTFIVKKQFSYIWPWKFWIYSSIYEFSLASLYFVLYAIKLSLYVLWLRTEEVMDLGRWVYLDKYIWSTYESLDLESWENYYTNFNYIFFLIEFFVICWNLLWITKKKEWYT